VIPLPPDLSPASDPGVMEAGGVGACCRVCAGVDWSGCSGVSAWVCACEWLRRCGYSMCAAVAEVWLPVCLCVLWGVADPVGGATSVVSNRLHSPSLSSRKEGQVGMRLRWGITTLGRRRFPWAVLCWGYGVYALRWQLLLACVRVGAAVTAWTRAGGCVWCCYCGVCVGCGSVRVRVC
jgi:hypothetical protein